ncbi:MAG: ABC transporter substrate-binding protein, partial [Clostridiales bacterium]|nr:ABC transporter substrate-binding protein [Clostridiales bacterium]
VSIKIGVTSWLGRFIQGLTPTECWPACDGVFDAIFKVDQVTKQIFSECLEDWYYEDDVTMIMKLKENVYFSNGMHATAEDLLYSYTSIIDRGSSQVAAIGPIIWEECITLDEYTVQFKFDRPFRPFENVMVYLLCKEWSLSLADGWEDMAWYYPVGSGPYECVEFKSEDIIVIRARDEYWNTDEVGPVYVDEWIIKFYKDYATMVMDLEIGEIAFCSPEPPDYNRYIRSGASGDGYEMFPLSTGCTMYFVFSFFDYPAWEDKRLREAVAVGVDWESLGSTTYQALYTPAESILPRNSRYFFAPGKYEYNPDRARELLAEAGYGPNNPLRLATTVSDEQQYKSNSENIQYQFSEIGIEADITVLDAASAIQAWNTGGSTDFMFWFRATGSPLSDPYEIMSGATRETGTTCTRVLDPKFRELWFTMVYNTDPAIYEPAIREIQQYNFDEIIYIPFAEYNVSIAYRTDVFTEAQLRNFVYGRNMYQLRRLGMLSSWE